ncbi:MAG: SWIM zinc finger family protein [Nanoarchaeota archaeon]|nr:SWIM zinc finger family protein [Nanoarchaeota archaeon]
MPKTIKDIKIEDVQDLFDSIIFLRGEEYFEEDFVKSIDALDSATISGTVRGNQNYKVTITVDSDGDISCECSCPCDFNCKHAAALLLKWLSIKGEHIKEIKEAKPLKKESIKDALNKKNKEELIGLLTEFISRYPELKTFVKIERKEIVSKVKNLFSDFVDWDEVSDLISELETITEGIKRNKSAWDGELLNEMEICSKIMIDGQENVHDEGDVGIFLEDWFLLHGEIFSSLKPSKQEKQQFMKKIMELIQKDEYSLDSSFEKAFIGMCASKEDIELIKEHYKPSESDEDEDSEHYAEFYLELYDKLGMNEEYLSIAKTEGFSSNLIDKLISMGRLEEALVECDKHNAEDSFWSVESKKLEILKKLGRNKELKKMLLDMIKEEGDIDDSLRLKKESTEGEWENFLRQIISDAKKKGRNSFLSKVYYHESDFKNAYEYSKEIRDMNYLELLAKKLSLTHPLLACEIFRKLCFILIDSGSGWPYKKAGKMLEAIKKLDKQGKFFNKTKNEIISKHKKKYSLMEIIKNV